MKRKPQEYDIQSPEVYYQPFEVKHAESGLSIEIQVEFTLDLDNPEKKIPFRFYFNHPLKRDTHGRKLKVARRGKELITKLALTAIEELHGREITLSREEYDELIELSKRHVRVAGLLTKVNLDLELLAGQVVPTMELLVPEKVTLAQALEAGRAFFVPRNPMTVEAILGGLVPLIQNNCSKDYVRNLTNLVKPLQLFYQGRPVHQTSIPQLEQLLQDVRHGKFLSEEDKQRIRKRKKDQIILIVNGHPQWYSDKSMVHFFEAWSRIFIRASSLDAWPPARKLPNEVMEKPRADLADNEALRPDDWGLLLPTLDDEEVRLVALLHSDIRNAEIQRLDLHHIITTDDVPTSVNLVPKIAKGNKGRKRGRNLALNAYSIALLSTAMPEGDMLFTQPVSSLMESIYKKARELGIETDKNCIRKMHDTYYYALCDARKAISSQASHSKTMSDRVYRSMASFDDAERVYMTFRPGTPRETIEFVNTWIDGFRGQLRGKVLPKRASRIITLENAPIENSEDSLAASCS